MGVEVHGFGEHGVLGCMGSRVRVVLCMGVEVHGFGEHGVLGCMGSRVHGVGMCCVLECTDVGCMGMG